MKKLFITEEDKYDPQKISFYAYGNYSCYYHRQFNRKDYDHIMKNFSDYGGGKVRWLIFTSLKFKI